MAVNIFKKFLDLLPATPRRVGVVLAVLDTTSVVTEMGGGDVTVIGTDYPAGTRVYFKDGTIEGQAPELPYVTQEE